MNILITGASGFIGSFLVEEALQRGMNVYAAVRPSSSKQYLKQKDIQFIELNLNDEQQLTKQLTHIPFDYVIHAAGITKCNDFHAFYDINTKGTENLCKALKNTQQHLKRFVFLSSLSVIGAVKEKQPHRPITDYDTPQPNTKYGDSKLKAEHVVRQLMSDIPYIILRPTGVYGPREKDYFLMAKSIAGHIDFAVGYRQQHITFIYVKDLVQAAFLALKANTQQNTFILSDGETYKSTAFSSLIKQELNTWCLRIKAPIFILKAVCAIAQRAAKIRKTDSTLNNDKYLILKQRNWMCDITPALQQLDYKPQYTLEEGVHETIEWYKQNKWL